MRTRRLTLGLLAHVDAGKTTLAEQLLYHCGVIPKPGRVDYKNAFLDHHALERARGITIFSKQAELSFGTCRLTLLDTPGHIDFSAETERTLQVLDAAILVINASDGVQGHTRTLWRLLKRYGVPVLLFINKMDLPDQNRHNLLKEVQQYLDECCVDFGVGKKDRDFCESLALCEELLMEKYLATGTIEEGDIIRLIGERKLFPCYFGSALKGEGIEALLRGVEAYVSAPDYGELFGARVFKITRDGQNNRLTHMKITGGSLRAKMLLSLPARGREGEEPVQEKADQIRIYSGDRFRTVEEAKAGEVCAVTGLEKTRPGDGLGREAASLLPILEPVLTYRLLLPEEAEGGIHADAFSVYAKLAVLEEEDPQLCITWDEHDKQIHMQVMGEVQIQILRDIIKERFGIPAEFDNGHIVYKETIGEPVVGMGHFEPLRHYAEVHLLMEPAEPGSGFQVESNCSEDLLEGNWQNLILSYLRETQHQGVLTGAGLTDMKVTLVAGAAHPRHTEGGDFRQAVCRAVRQGLQSTRNVLLEPVYQFQLELPVGMLGRAMSDIGRMQGSFEPPRITGEEAVLTGSAPVASMQGYQTEVLSYTRGCGRLFCSLKGYAPCHNAEAVIAAKGYDPDADSSNTGGSVFCAHGAGFSVAWDKAAAYMHVDSGIRLPVPHEAEGDSVPGRPGHRSFAAGEKEAGKSERARKAADAGEKELEEIFHRTFGAVRRSRAGFKSREKYSFPPASAPLKAAGGERENSSGGKEYLLVDGYNIIFAWKELKELAAVNLEAARGKLADLLCNYQGYKGNTVILVFDAWKVEGNPGEESRYCNIHIVYTKEAETADMYIEKATHEMGRKYRVTVATSDLLEQMIVWGQGALRLSAAGLYEEIEEVNRRMKEEHLGKAHGEVHGKAQGKNYLSHHVLEEMTDLTEE